MEKIRRGECSPEAEGTSESLEGKLQRARELDIEIENVKEEIKKVTKDLEEKKQNLKNEFSEIAKEVAKNIPQIHHTSSENDYDLRDGKYYLLGLPEGVNLESVDMDKEGDKLLIDGKEFEGDEEDWDYQYAPDLDAEEYILRAMLRKKETGKYR
ncbi:MAG: hypothetical protein V1770_02655 [bacterium]